LERRPLENARKNGNGQSYGSPAGYLAHAIECELDNQRGVATLAVWNTRSHLECGFRFPVWSRMEEEAKSPAISLDGVSSFDALRHCARRTNFQNRSFREEDS
jgi:hypothetical protein